MDMVIVCRWMNLIVHVILDTLGHPVRTGVTMVILQPIVTMKKFVFVILVTMMMTSSAILNAQEAAVVLIRHVTAEQLDGVENFVRNQDAQGKLVLEVSAAVDTDHAKTI